MDDWVGANLKHDRPIVFACQPTSSPLYVPTYFGRARSLPTDWPDLPPRHHLSREWRWYIPNSRGEPGKEAVCDRIAWACAVWPALDHHQWTLRNLLPFFHGIPISNIAHQSRDTTVLTGSSIETCLVVKGAQYAPSRLDVHL